MSTVSRQEYLKLLATKFEQEKEARKKRYELLHPNTFSRKEKKMTEPQHQQSGAHSHGPAAPEVQTSPVAMVTPENPYGNLPGDPKGFKRIEVKTAADMLKEEEEKAAKAAKEAEKVKK